MIFHPALAPYRVDLFNALAPRLDLKVLFLRDRVLSQPFDQDALRRSVRFEHGYLLDGWEIRGRGFRKGIRREIARFGPDVVVSQEFSPISLYVCALRRFGRPGAAAALWTDDSPHLCRTCGRVRRAARAVATRWADSLIVCSEATREWFIGAGIPREKVFSAGILQDEKAFAQSLREVEDTARQYAQDLGLSGKKVVLSVGRLVPVKGVDRIIRAFADGAARSAPEAVLVIVGDGPQMDYLRQLSASLGIAQKVRFQGRLEGRSLKAWYLLGDVFVLASNWEPFGAVVNEALLAGMPVLCSVYGGASGLIAEGQNGHVFHPEGATLASLIERVLADAHWARDRRTLQRPSLMRTSFEDSVSAFVAAVEHAAAARRGRARRPEPDAGAVEPDAGASGYVRTCPASSDAGSGCSRSGLDQDCPPR